VRLQVGPRSFKIELQEGRNRQIRKMCEALGYNVVKLHRDSVSGITLSNLQEGKWLPLTRAEMIVINSVLADAGCAAGAP
jgi:pseudouridine synthase